MGRVFDEMKAFLDGDDWHTSNGSVPNSLVLRVKESNGQWSCVAYAAEDQQQFVFYSVAPLKATPDRLAQTAEYLHRANWGLRIGNFELDWSDGEIRFKTSIDVEDEPLTPQLAKNVVYPNIALMDRYIGGLYQVIQNGAAAKDAIAEAEKA